MLVTPKKVKVKVGFLYSVTYAAMAMTSRALQSQEVAVDWQEPSMQIVSRALSETD